MIDQAFAIVRSYYLYGLWRDGLIGDGIADAVQGDDPQRLPDGLVRQVLPTAKTRSKGVDAAVGKLFEVLLGQNRYGRRSTDG